MQPKLNLGDVVNADRLICGDCLVSGAEPKSYQQVSCWKERCEVCCLTLGFRRALKEQLQKQCNLTWSDWVNADRLIYVHPLLQLIDTKSLGIVRRKLEECNSILYLKIEFLTKSPAVFFFSNT
jgi:hypothetical protein